MTGWGLIQLVERQQGIVDLNTISFHPGGKWYYYYLYSLERAGILSGVKRVGNKDWYLEGVLQLLERQRKDGSWTAHVPANCFALLFLRRATAPVATLTGTR